MPSTGNTDPAIPFVVAMELEKSADQFPVGSSSSAYYLLLASYWNAASVGMTRGGTTTWYQKSPGPDEMTYECDANLGAPPPVDCTQIEWNQLGPASVSPPSDTITVGPGVVEFLHQSK